MTAVSVTVLVPFESMVAVFHQFVQITLAAFAVAALTTVRAIQAEADEVVCLYAPDEFYAVGHFFEDFGQVSDEQVVEILDREQRKRAVGD